MFRIRLGGFVCATCKFVRAVRVCEADRGGVAILENDFPIGVWGGATFQENLTWTFNPIPSNAALLAKHRSFFSLPDAQKRAFSDAEDPFDGKLQDVSALLEGRANLQLSEKQKRDLEIRTTEILKKYFQLQDRTRTHLTNVRFWDHELIQY